MPASPPEQPRNERGKPICGSPRSRRQSPEGAPCQRPAGWGTDHVGHGRCKLHGGASPAGTVHATRIAAGEAMRTYGVDRPVDPVAGLLEEIARTAGHIDWLRHEIEQLDPKALTFGVTGIDTRKGLGPEGPIDETTTKVAAAVHVLLQLYLEERKHFAGVCHRAVAAGVAERQVRLAERQGEIAAEAVRGILSGLELTEEQRRRVPELVQRHLGAILRAA